MRRPHAESRFDHRSAQIHFRARGFLRQPQKNRMVDRIRADGDERISRKLRKLAPVHTQFGTKRGAVDLIKCREPANDVAHFVFRGAVAQPPVKPMIQRLLLRQGVAVEFVIASVDSQTDAIVASDHRFKRQPPQISEAIRKARRHVDREWHARVLKHGIGEA